LPIAEFWRVASFVPRAALVLALTSATVVVGTFFGWNADAHLGVWFAIHLSVMMLIFALMARTAQHHVLALKRRSMRLQRVSVPVWLQVGAVICLGLTVVMILGSFWYWGEGGAEIRDGHYVWIRSGAPDREITRAAYEGFTSGALRIFATGWLAFCLVVAWWGHVVAERIRQFRVAPGAAA